MLLRLRQATGALHAQLESVLQLGLQSRAEPITQARYVRFLHVMQAVTPALEDRIARVPGWFELMPRAQQRRRAERLERDLIAVLGSNVGRLPPRCALPEIELICHALGASYVLEGSSLGGVVIARSLGPALGLTAEHGLSFVCAYGTQLREYWDEFTQTLELWARTASAPEQDLAVSCAQATFRALIVQATATHVQ